MSKSSSPCTNPLLSVSRAPFKIGIIVTFMFHSFFQFHSKVKVLIPLFAFIQFYFIVSRDSKVHNSAPFFFCWLLLDLLVIPKFGELFLSHNPRGVFAPNSPGQILGCAYSICSYSQTSTSCTIPCGSPWPPIRALSYTLYVLICSICLLFVSITT